MKPKPFPVFLASVSIIVLGSALFAIYPLIELMLYGRQVRQLEAQLLDPEIYEPVAETLALYCQSDPKFFPDVIDYAWLPASLKEIGYGTGRIMRSDASVSLGGSHYDFGYNLTIDAARSGGDVNVWQLHRYRSNREDEYLCEVTIAKSRTLSREFLQQRVAEGYNAEIARDADNLYAREKKIALYLRFDDCSSVRLACREMRDALPDYWWAVLVNALTEHPHSAEEADQLIRSWVDKKETYFRCLDLAYYYQLTNRARDAIDATLRAVDCDLEGSEAHGGNAAHRGYNAAVFVFQCGEYRAARIVCEKLIASLEDGKYGKLPLIELKDHCDAALLNSSVDFVWPTEMTPFAPFSDAGIDVDKLVKC